MNIFGFIKEIFKPAADIVDSLHTSKEEKMTLVNELARIEFGMQEKILEYETKLLDVQQNIIIAEAKGDGWLQKSWRPITMLAFLVLVVCDVFGVLEFRLSDEAWTLLQIGLGGYTIGRSLEKISPQFKDVLKKK